jgi:hypothetical protein
MDTPYEGSSRAVGYPVGIVVPAAMENRNRLTTLFRFFLAIPHLLLVGGPVAASAWIGWNSHDTWDWGWGSGAGLLGVVACFAAAISWLVILVTGRHPQGLYDLAAYYLRWRVRAISYLTLLRDEYPPFGDDAYPAQLELAPPAGERDRLTVLLRFFFALPHLFLLALLGVVWAFTTAVAWVMILVTGRYPEALYGFAIGVLAWDTRVEAYMLMLTDEYPPFTLRV